MKTTYCSRPNDANTRIIETCEHEETLSLLRRKVNKTHLKNVMVIRNLFVQERKVDKCQISSGKGGKARNWRHFRVKGNVFNCKCFNVPFSH